jgi:hypothetical protein
MKNLLFVAIFLGGLALVLYTFYTSKKFRTAYRFDGRFSGILREASVAIEPAEQSYACIAGADRDALYMLKDSSGQPTSRTQGPRLRLSHSLRIPWDDIQSAPGHIYLKRIVWFKGTSPYFALWMPETDALQLLADAGRALNTDAGVA